MLSSSFCDRHDDNLSEKYTLPQAADVSEMDRLTLQQRMWRLILQGLYPAVLGDDIQRILNPDIGRPAILDLGCGAGAWAVDIASAFPHAEVTGFDLSPIPILDIPKNCCFVQGNALECDMDKLNLHRKFDLVHCRSVLWHQTDPKRMIAIIASCLKPGGLALIVDGSESNRVYGKDRHLLSPDEDIGVAYSTYANWIKTYAMIARGHSSTYDYVDLLREGAQFVGIDFQEILCPMNWEGQDVVHGRQIGAIMYENLRKIFPATQRAMAGAGITPQTLENMESRLYEEMESLKIYVTWQVVWGFKS